MFSVGMKGIITQEMVKDRDKLEKKIEEMELILEKAQPQSESESRKKEDWAKSYTQWGCYEDTDELEESISTAKDDLAKLNVKIKNHSSDLSDKQCDHRYNCSCSGDKSAERQVVAMKTSDRLDKMSLFKEEGNSFYAKQNCKEALALYEKTLIYFEYCLMELRQSKRLPIR